MNNYPCNPESQCCKIFKHGSNLVEANMLDEEPLKERIHLAIRLVDQTPKTFVHLLA